MNAKGKPIRIDENGRIIIPPTIRKTMGLKAGDHLAFAVENGIVRVELQRGDTFKNQEKLQHITAPVDSASDEMVPCNPQGAQAETMDAEQKLPRGVWERPRGSGIYWIRYTDADGKRCREKCGSLTNAKQRLSIRHTERLSGTPLTPEPIKSFSLSELIDDALSYARAQNSEYAAKDLAYKMDRIRSSFGRAIARNITQSQIRDWLEKEAAKHDWKPSSRNRYQAAWSLIFRVAIQNKKMRESPVRGIRLKRENNQRIRYLSREEEDRLRATILERFPQYDPIFRLALHSGMRASEMFRSKVGDYDPKTGQFAIEQTKVHHGSQYRYIPASSRLVEAYRELAEGKSEGDLLCTKIEPRGGTHEMNRIHYWFNPCVRAAKLKKHFTWHDLRHTFASCLAGAGIPMPTLMQYMGHRSLQMTRRYEHLIPGTDSKVRKIEGEKHHPDDWKDNESDDEGRRSWSGEWLG